MGRVEGKVAIVTGGASGIGKASCLLLAKEGAKVAVTDIKNEDGKKVVSEIEGNSGVAQYWHINTSDEKEVSQAFSEIYEKFGRIDVLVNNAGIRGVAKPSDEIDESEWDRVILFEQRTSRWDNEYHKKWLYTAVTRARKKLFIISDYY